MGLVPLLIAGLMTSGQVTPEDAAKLATSPDLSALASALESKPVNWQLAAEQVRGQAPAGDLLAVGCASGQRVDQQLPKLAIIRANAAMARRLDLTAGGKEVVQGDSLSVEHSERSVAQLPPIKIAERGDVLDARGRTVCVLVSVSGRTK